MTTPLRERTIARRESLDDGARRHHPSGQCAVCDPKAVLEAWLAAAREVGFFRAALSSVEDFPRQAAEVSEFLAAERHGQMSYLAARSTSGELVRASPRAALAGARSALVVALPYPSSASTPHGTSPVSLRRSLSGSQLHPERALPKHALPEDEAPRGKVARYAGGRDYHHVLKERLLVLADVLADLLGRVVLARACVDTAPVLERQLAERAGFVFLGKNTLAIAPGAGSLFHLGVLLTDWDAPAEHAPPGSLQPAGGCGSCTSCLASCPTGALDDAYRIDARRCISYLTIEHKGSIPRELRSLLGAWVFGCDACQTSCPYNSAKGVPASDPLLLPSPFWEGPDLGRLLFLSSSDYKRLVRGTALRRVSRELLARNAAIALGNSAAVSAVPLLSAALQGHFSELVRVHAAWALGELRRAGLPDAQSALEAARPTAFGPVRAEIDWALASGLAAGSGDPPGPV